MKLVLYGGGDARDNARLDRQLIESVGKSSIHMSFIPSESYESEVSFRDFVKQYRAYGVKSFLHLPVDVPFDNILLDEVLSSDIIHLGGGNTFYFLRHLKRSGVFPKLREFVKRGGILTGLSAGAIMMTPTITTASFPEFDRDDNDENLKDWRALKLVPFHFFPHYSHNRAYKEEMLHFTKKAKSTLYACPNGSGLIIDEDRIKVVGTAYLFTEGKVQRLLS